jgi:hypothetical protein
VCSRRFGSGAETFEGDEDLEGEAEDRLTGLFVGEGGLSSSDAIPTTRALRYPC